MFSTVPVRYHIDSPSYFLCDDVEHARGKSK